MILKYNSVVIIDDDIDDHDFISSALKDFANPPVSTFFLDPTKALEHLCKGTLMPDLILLDLNMPALSGNEVLSRIKKHESISSIPVIIFSTSNHRPTMDLMKQMGAEDYIVKPNSYTALISVLKNIFHYNSST